jgi:hypothetical protein
MVVVLFTLALGMDVRKERIVINTTTYKLINLCDRIRSVPCGVSILDPTLVYPTQPKVQLKSTFTR